MSNEECNPMVRICAENERLREEVNVMKRHCDRENELLSDEMKENERLRAEVAALRAAGEHLLEVMESHEAFSMNSCERHGDGICDCECLEDAYAAVRKALSPAASPAEAKESAVSAPRADEDNELDAVVFKLVEQNQDHEAEAVGIIDMLMREYAYPKPGDELSKDAKELGVLLRDLVEAWRVAPKEGGAL